MKVTFETYNLDSDVAIEKKNNGCSDYFLNCEDYESRGVIKNVRGNTMVSFTFPEETNKCVGVAKDYKNNCIYYFVANTNTVTPMILPNNTLGSGIYKYDIRTKTIEPVVQELIKDFDITSLGSVIYTFPATGSFLNLLPDKKVINAKVTNGMLFWLDASGRPCKINIEKSINFMRFLLSNGVYGIPTLTYLPKPGNVTNEFYPNIIKYSYKEDFTTYYQITIYDTDVGHYDFYAWRKSTNGITWGAWKINDDSGTNLTTQSNFIIDGVFTLSWFNAIGRTKGAIDPATQEPTGDTWTLLASTIDMYKVFDSETISVIKKKPTHPPIVKYTDDNTKNYNNIYGKLYQIAYRWIFDDYEKSVYSDHSKTEIPLGEEDSSGTIIENKFRNNTIDITIDTGHETVNQVEIICREGELGAWGTIAIIDKYDLYLSDNVDYTYRFTNDVNKTEIAQVDAGILQDYVPQYVGQQEIIENTRLVYGDITEGYNNLNPDVTIDYVNQHIDLIYAYRFYSITKEGYTPEEQYVGWNNHYFLKEYYTISLPDLAFISVGTIILLTLQKSDGTLVPLSYTVPAIITPAYPNNAITYFVNVINAIFPSSAIAQTYGIKILNKEYDYWRATWDFMEWNNARKGAETVYWAGGTIYFGDSSANKYKTLKSCTYKQFGLIYKDEYGRCGSVYTNDSMRIYIEPFVDLTDAKNSGKLKELTATKNLNYRRFVKWEINHIPPDWAYSYEWVIIPDNTNYLYFVIDSDPTKTKIVSYGGKVVWQLGFNSILLNKINSTQNCILEPWIWERGDRLRFICTDLTGNHVTFANCIDVEIIGSDTTTKDIYIEPINGWTITTMQTTKLTIEIYRPVKESVDSAEIYQTIGESFDIINPGTHLRYHSGGNNDSDSDNYKSFSRNQTNLLSARGVLLWGDAYIFNRFTTYSTLPIIIAESKDYSDYYDSDLHSYGKSYAVIPAMERKEYEASYRYGMRLIPNTQTNGLSTFPYNYYDSLPDIYGKITGLRQIGDTLKIYQEKKNSSRYLSRATFKSVSQAGSDLIATVTDILGELNMSDKIWGCQNPESMVSSGTHNYFWDNISGKFIRDSVNGMFCITDISETGLYPVNTIFQAISDKIKTLTYPEKLKVYTVFDEKKDYLMATFVYENTNLEGFVNQTLCFDEGKNAWKGYYSFIPEMYGSLGNTVIAFLNANLWIQDSNSLRNYFFNTQFTSKLKILANKSEEKNVFQAIVIESNSDKWTAPTITTTTDSQYPNGMSTEIRAFKKKEGKLYSHIPMDKNTPMKGSDAFKMVNGRNMRGRVLEVVLENTSTDEMTLQSVEIKSVESKV